MVFGERARPGAADDALVVGYWGLHSKAREEAFGERYNARAR